VRLRHGHVLDTDCRPDSPRCDGRTLLYRRSRAVCSEATRNIGLGSQDSDRVCGSRRHKSPLHQNWGRPEPRSPATLRTQLDIFEKIIPELEKRFTVHAFDYPGHGWSDISKATYAPEDFYQWTAAYLEKNDIRQATIVGISIGATISLVLAARQNPRVSRVIAVNPYDYWPAGGIRKSSLAARLVLTPSGVPIVGATIMRLRNRYVSDRIFEGGLAAPEALPKALAQELYEVGARLGHYQGFLSLLAHERLWPKARDEYASIKVPVLLIYGDQDWAPPVERERTRSLIPNVSTEIVPNGNHFLSLDRPRELQHLIVGFAHN
jgi:pimeloyl-ACP methyl ester carboxylesterase